MVARKPPNKLAAWPGSGDVSQNLGYESQPLKAALYIRVSTDRQAEEGDSLEEQESELKKYCEFRKFHIKNIYIERGKSGGNTKRPEYQKLIKDMQAQRINTVVVKKLDRLSRSLLDFEALMVIMQTHEVEFISIRESFDTTTAMGKAMLRIALVFAQLEREQTSERISDVMQYRASLGHFNGGQPPFGYVALNKELMISNQQKPLVELIYKRFLETLSIMAVVNYLNDTKQFSIKKTPWTDSQILYILRNPTYKGFVIWKGNLYPGLHQPIIAPSLWDRVAAIFESTKSNLGRTKSELTLQKLVICGACSTPLMPSFAYNRYKTKYWYYRCGSTQHGKHRTKKLGCTFKYVSAQTLHEQVHHSLMQLTQEALPQLKKKVETHNEHIHTAIKSLAQNLLATEEALQKLKAKKGEYTDVLISAAFSAQDRHRIHERLNELELEERQYQNKLTVFQLEKSQAENQVVSLDSLLTTLLFFQENSDVQSQPYKNTLHKILNHIQVYKEKLVFEFSDLPWPVEIPLKSP